ncbi:MAG: hypothetical protein ACLFVO_04190 [Chloroflexaceae bacterium]
MVSGRTYDRQHPILHFEQADNFALAYYAGGNTEPKGLPFSGEPQIEPEPGILDRERRQQLVSGAGTIGIGGNVRNSQIVPGNSNTLTSTGDISKVHGQVTVGSNIAQVSKGSSTHVDNSWSAFYQRGQQVGVNQYNAARHMTIGPMDRASQRPRLSDSRLAQMIQAAMQHHGLDGLLFALGSHTTIAIDPATLGAEPAAQARTLIATCCSQHQRSALVEALLDMDAQILGTPEEQDDWLAWARNLDNH